MARKAGVEPYRRPGWRVLLEGPFELPTPVTFADLRAAEPAIRAAFDTVKAQHQGSLYLPLEISNKRPLRPTQFYLTKAPLAWLGSVPGLTAVQTAADRPGASDITGPFCAKQCRMNKNSARTTYQPTRRPRRASVSHSASTRISLTEASAATHVRRMRWRASWADQLELRGRTNRSSIWLGSLARCCMSPRSRA